MPTTTRPLARSPFLAITLAPTTQPLEQVHSRAILAVWTTLPTASTPSLTNTGNDNTALGFGAGAGATTGTNNVYIGASIVGVAGESNACYIASIFGQSVDPTDAVAVFVDGHGKLGTTASSRRFKRDIKPMDNASETILALKPMTFHYKNDPEGTSQYGLIAEEVAEVNPNLVVRDKNGQILSVHYDKV